jgi:hypothetical protein
MRLRPTSSTQPPPAEGEAKAKPDRGDWRWAVIHFPCLEGVVPRGRIIMVSDKKHIPEAIRKYPDLVLWHEKELALYSEQMDLDVFDEQTFIAVNRLKHKTHGWYIGAEEGPPAENNPTDAVEGLE